jgi:Flp pilus assembly protein TadG
MSLLRRIFGGFIRPARRGFIRDERGTTAIEFGILGIPFFALLAATLETAYVFLGAQILDTAVQDAARFIRTGQLQNGGFGSTEKDKFRARICDELYSLFDCTKLWIGVETVTNFTSATVTSPLPTTCTVTLCEWAQPEVYSSGNGSSVMLVRVYYKWPTLVALGGFNLANTGANSRLLASVRVFANEPF